MLPRKAVIIVGIAGMAVTFIAFIYLFVEFYSFSEEASGFSASVVTVPHLGSLIAGGFFLLITVSQLIPALSKTES